MEGGINPEPDNSSESVNKFSTGVIVEDQCFTWKIENFDVVRKSRDMIQKQRFDFSAGHTVGLPSEWSCRLWYCVKSNNGVVNDLVPINSSNVEWIGVFYHLEKFPEDIEELTFVFSYVIYKKNGDVFYSLEVPARCLKEVGDTAGWGKKCVIMKRANVEDLPLIDGALVIHSRFRLYAPKEANVDLITRTSRFQTLSIQKLGMDLAASLEHNFSMGGIDQDASSSSTVETTNPVAKIISKDGQEFVVNRGFLSARSKVFQAMFLSQMQESQTGIIHIDDLSSQTVLVLLHYIYTGILHDKWRHPDVIVELTYAADKYEFIELLQFLDDVLGTICTKETAGKLLVLTSRLSLKKAENEIFRFIQRHVATPQQLMTISKDIVAENTVNFIDTPNCKSANDLIKLDPDID